MSDVALTSFGPLVHRPCPACGGTGSRAMLENQCYSFAPLDVMAVVECRACRFLFTDPIPSAAWFERYRDLNRSWGGDGSWMTRHWQDEHEHERFVDGLAVLRTHSAGGKLVDVGCGPGLFVEMARGAGFDAIGIDTYPQQGLQHFKCAAVSDLPPDSFDVLTLWCVVAHDADFLTLLRNCRRALKPGGLILIETPNMTLWRWARGARVVLERAGLRQVSRDSLGVYGHINHFTAGSLRAALREAEFEAPAFHMIRNHRGARNVIDRLKRALFRLSRSRVNVVFPLVAAARKPV